MSTGTAAQETPAGRGGVGWGRGAAGLEYGPPAGSRARKAPGPEEETVTMTDWGCGGGECVYRCLF